jgi:hypothetical protein
MISCMVAILEAVRRQLKRQQRQKLHRSLQSPHPETRELAQAGFEEWAGGLPREKASDLVDVRTGRSVRRVAGRGWLDAK